MNLKFITVNFGNTTATRNLVNSILSSSLEGNFSLTIIDNKSSSRSKKDKYYSESAVAKAEREVVVYNYILKLSPSQISGTWLDELSNEDVEKIIEGGDSGFDKDDYDEDADLVKAFRGYSSNISKEILTSDDAYFVFLFCYYCTDISNFDK